jgi:hypothetical protein
MNLQHAAALAILSWYLVGPPITGVHILPTTPFPHVDTVNTEVPFTKWTILKSFDTAQDCEAGPSAMVKQHYTQHNALVYEDAVCIATDDPRLKGH